MGTAALSVVAPRAHSEKLTRRTPHPRATLSDVSWHAAEGMSFADWQAYGRRLGVMGRSVGWWIGDWLAYGNHAFGERYARASRITGYDSQTLMNMAYVASRFASSRRRGKLSWSHHAEIAAMEPAEQDFWLARAETERLSVRCLRDEVRRVRRERLAREEEPVDAAPADPGAHPSSDVKCPECGFVFH
jgi:hypothetical protein